MKAIRPREGVELVEICGEYLLVATKEARDHCPFVTQINKSAADYWRLLDGAYTLQSLADKAASEFGKDAKAAFIGALAFISKASKAGYLVSEDV